MIIAPPHPGVTTRADYVAAHLAGDPVFVTDTAPRAIGTQDLARIREAVQRMPVPTYVAIVAQTDPQQDPQGSPDRLIALLHDKLGRSGVYLVLPPNGIGLTAEQFGVNVPVSAAEREVTFAEPYDAGAPRVIERFVDDIRSGQAQQRYEKVRARNEAGWEPKPYHREEDRSDTAEQAGVYSGMGLALLAALAIAIRRRRRSR
jgi:MYXO-CTERM domain-containing protein